MAKKRGKRPGLRARSKNARVMKTLNVPRETIEQAIYRSAGRAVVEMASRLSRCREIMEANDPLNARDIFGPPEEA